MFWDHDVDTFNHLTPSIKPDLNTRISVGGMTEGISYRIIDIDYSIFNNELMGREVKEAPLVGETISLSFEFKPDEPCSTGWEHLILFVGRLGNPAYHGNYVRYFKNIKDLARALSGLKFELDKDFAIQRVQQLKAEIKNYVEDYQLFTRCPKCNSDEIDASTPRTVYACGSSDYDQRPGTFKQSEECLDRESK